MAEGARLESVFRGNSNVGSNPTLSAIFSTTYELIACFRQLAKEGCTPVTAIFRPAMNTQRLRLRYHSPQMAEGRLRHRFDEYLGKAEVAIYSILAAMLSVTAFAAIATAGNIAVGWLPALDDCRSDSARIE